MNRNCTLGCLIAVAMMSGCAFADLAVEDEAAPRATSNLKSSFQVIPEEYLPAKREAQGDSLRLYAAEPWTFYLNREGGAYSPGFNDSRNNRTSLADETSMIPSWNVSDAGWQEVLACVNGLFADYDVVITDQDPGTAPHIEAVVAGSYTDLLTSGGARPAGGVSPFTPECDIIDNSIVFIFADDYGDDYRTVCEVTAQEIAHSFGLDHEFLCEDPMSYLEDCGPKVFRDEAAPCGEYSQRACRDMNSPPAYDCERDTQNSVAMLSARLGRKGETGAGPPVVGGCRSSGGGTGWLALAMLAFGALLRRGCRRAT